MREDLAVATGISLVTIGLWMWIGPRALAVTGSLILWIAMPSRAPFFASPPPSDDVRRKS